jgi:hypothetical protein
MDLERKWPWLAAGCGAVALFVLVIGGVVAFVVWQSWDKPAAQAAKGTKPASPAKPQTPGDSVKQILKSANEGVYSEANAGLSAQIRKVIEERAMTRQLWDGITRAGTIAKVEIVKEEIRGEGAIVAVKVHYKNAKAETRHEALLKEDGQWRFSSQSIIAWSNEHNNERFTKDPPDAKELEP